MRKIALFLLAAAALSVAAQHLVILHTNDTHSHIDAENGIGGVLQRKAIIDSVREAEKNVMVVDAGDIVQGSLYFKLFGGKVEYPLMDMMGYDIQILGNHEFDNGIDSLARFYPATKTVKLSSNYDFTGTPLEGVFVPWTVREVEGKRVGFLGLNLNPEGMIAPGATGAMKFNDIIDAANRTAEFLRKKEKCDVVIAVSHIGYEDKDNPQLTMDPEVAAKSKDIDIIIGGHSHTLISPVDSRLPYRIKNAGGKDVIVAQTGRYGAKIGKIDVDLRNPRKSVYSLIDVAGIDSSRFDRDIMRFLEPYRHVVDSVNARSVGMAASDMPNTKKYATSLAATNLISDISQWYGSLVLDSLARNGSDIQSYSDLAVMNSGGVRRPIPVGTVYEGEVYDAFPFPNKFWIMRFKGSDLDTLLRQAVEKGSQGVSANVRISVKPGTSEVEGIMIDGRPIDPDRDYYLTTIDYLGKGGDYMDSFKKGEVVWKDTLEMCAPVMRYVVEHEKNGIPVGSDTESRIVEARHHPRR